MTLMFVELLLPTIVIIITFITFIIIITIIILSIAIICFYCCYCYHYHLAYFVTNSCNHHYFHHHLLPSEDGHQVRWVHHASAAWSAHNLSANSKESR